MSEIRMRRCAVYTRKSTEEGLEQDFNSLQAQREACESFIRSQRGEGWRLLPEAYDDGGISGGTMERPALRRLLSEIEAGRVDVVVVYKVDRLTRSLSDFSKMVELFDRMGVSFVAVTQQFNTTTSMGRLTLNVLLSFAQFEREVTGERIRDKVAASKRKGMWMGGGLPRGYRVEDRKLLIVPAQAEQVRVIYQEFLKSTGLRELGLQLRDLGITATTRSGDERRPISRGALHQLLRNPIYMGLIRHKGQCHPGQHAPIIDKPLWDAVQTKLTQGRGERSPHRRSETSPLLGKLFDERGRGLTASYATARGTRYPYYQTRVDDLDEDRRAGLDSRGWRLPAREIERQIGSIVDLLVGDRSAISANAMAAGASLDEVEALLRVTAQSSADDRLAWVERVQLSSDQIRLSIDLPGARSIKLEREIPIALRRRGCGRRLVIGAAIDQSPKRDPDPRLMTLLRVGMAYWEQLGTDQALNLRDYAKDAGIEERFVGRALPMAFLAPDLVEAIVDGTLSPEWTAERLLRIPRLPLAWKDQRELLGTS